MASIPRLIAASISNPRLVAEWISQRGVRGLLRVSAQHMFPVMVLGKLGVLEDVAGKNGLEIGGPSRTFKRGGLAPAYVSAARIDNCNFAALTLWEGAVSTGETFQFNRRRAQGRQHVAEASELNFALADTYDFLLSSHMIEHSANPLRALAEWHRVLKPGAPLILVVPHRDGTFDHRRPTTRLGHLIEDFEQSTGEDDLTHLDEILALHDLDRDPGCPSRAVFEARSHRNAEIRGLHHHVFDVPLAAEMALQAGFEVQYAERRTPMDIVIVARKPTVQQVAKRRGMAC